MLYALDQATGATLWSHALGGIYNWSGLTYDAGRVFTLNFSGLLTAFDAGTGTIDWATLLPGQVEFSSAPTATGGYVYTAGSGTAGTLYAVSEATGDVAWTAAVKDGGESSPAVDSAGVYVTYTGGQDYAFNPLSGSLLWHRDTGVEGGGGRTPVLADGYVFGRDDPTGNAILSAISGVQAGAFTSSVAPAIGGGRAYVAGGGGLTAVNGSGLGTPAWIFRGDLELDTAPLILGGLVFEGSSTGELYAVDSSGASVWSTNVGSPILGPFESTAGQPLTGLSAGEGTLVVPAGSTLVAYAGANVGSGIPASSAPPTVTGTPAFGEALGADVGGWTALPTSYGYQWQRCVAAGNGCVAIAGAAAESYTPTSADAGSTLEVTVIATNADGTSAPITSAPSAPLPPPIPTDMTTPTITGTPVAGQALSASPGAWTGSPTSYGYQWLSCAGGSCTSEPGSTSSSYVVAASDVGTQIEVLVTASNATGTSTAVSSAATPPVTAAKLPSPPARVLPDAAAGSSTAPAPTVDPPAAGSGGGVATVRARTVVRLATVRDIADLIHGGLRATVECAGRCHVELRLVAIPGDHRLTGTIAVTSARLGTGQTRTLALMPARRDVGLLAVLARVRLRVRVTITDGGSTHSYIDSLTITR